MCCDPAAALPETRYVESDGLSIAWQVFGSGTQDLVVVPPIISHVDANWQYEGYARMLRRLGESFRVIIFDKRGQGMSDRFEGAPTLEERMDDLLAVMQAAGSERAILFASSEGGAMGALFAATHPTRVERLVTGEPHENRTDEWHRGDQHAGQRAGQVLLGVADQQPRDADLDHRVGQQRAPVRQQRA